MRSHIKRIGNSKGIVIPPAFLSKFHLDKDSDIDIEIGEEGILIKPIENPRSRWEEKFQEAIKNGEYPEGDLFEDLSNEFDDTEWEW